MEKILKDGKKIILEWSIYVQNTKITLTFLQFFIKSTLTFLHARLMRLFKQYLTIGGMPQVVDEYVQNKDITALQPIYESLLDS